MSRVLLDEWNLLEKKLGYSTNSFAPLCFCEEHIRHPPEDQTLIEYRKELIFTVVCRYKSFDPKYDQIKEHVDRRLFDMVVSPIRKCVYELADYAYARDFDGTIESLGRLIDVVTKGQSALDNNKSR